LIAEIAQSDPFVAGCIPKRALFRINRDMRFSHDKSPYKTFFSASITAAGLKKPSKGGGPSYYFQIDRHDKLMVAAGEWLPPADRLLSIRQQIAADPAPLAKIARSGSLVTRFGGLQEEGKLKRPPKGFDAEHPGIELIKLKHFIVWSETDIGSMMPEVVADKVLEACKAAQPLVMWLRTVKTPSAQQD